MKIINCTEKDVTMYDGTNYTPSDITISLVDGRLVTTLMEPHASNFVGGKGDFPVHRCEQRFGLVLPPYDKDTYYIVTSDVLHVAERDDLIAQSLDRKHFICRRWFDETTVKKR